MLVFGICSNAELSGGAKHGRNRFPLSLWVQQPLLPTRWDQKPALGSIQLAHYLEPSEEPPYQEFRFYGAGSSQVIDVLDAELGVHFFSEPSDVSLPLNLIFNCLNANSPMFH